jgi:hypothetical protein
MRTGVDKKQKWNWPYSITILPYYSQHEEQDHRSSGIQAHQRLTGMVSDITLLTPIVTNLPKKQ